MPAIFCTTSLSSNRSKLQHKKTCRQKAWITSLTAVGPNCNTISLVCTACTTSLPGPRCNKTEMPQSTTSFSATDPGCNINIQSQGFTTWTQYLPLGCTEDTQFWQSALTSCTVQSVAICPNCYKVTLVSNACMWQHTAPCALPTYATEKRCVCVGACIRVRVCVHWPLASLELIGHILHDACQLHCILAANRPCKVCQAWKTQTSKRMIKDPSNTPVTHWGRNRSNPDYFSATFRYKVPYHMLERERSSMERGKIYWPENNFLCCCFISLCLFLKKNWLLLI